MSRHAYSAGSSILYTSIDQNRKNKGLKCLHLERNLTGKADKNIKTSMAASAETYGALFLVCYQPNHFRPIQVNI